MSANTKLRRISLAVNAIALEEGLKMTSTLDRTTVTIADVRGRPTVTVDEAAAFLGISRGAAYQAVRVGEITSLKLGRRLVIPTNPLLAMVGAATTPATETHSAAA